MSNNIESKIFIIPATLGDYSCIQNMARFYVYDLSRECASISSDWAMPGDGLYESFDFKSYFIDIGKKAYLIKVYDEIAGFVLLNQEIEDHGNKWPATLKPLGEGWNMGEFFIIAKFQRKGIASHVAKEIWYMHPGKWEVSVIPLNVSAIKFWEKTIHAFTNGAFKKGIRDVAYDAHCPQRIIFEFDTLNMMPINDVPQFMIRTSQLSDISEMVALSKAKCKLYEKAQPQFWRYAGEEGDNAQNAWFKELLKDKNYVMFTAESETQEILGFIIGKLIPAPEVYNPSGLTLMIDDFCVKSENLWTSVGAGLIDESKPAAQRKGAVQIVVVCGAHDHAKRVFLENQNLSIASEWFVGDIS